MADDGHKLTNKKMKDYKIKETFVTTGPRLKAIVGIAVRNGAKVKPGYARQFVCGDIKVRHVEGVAIIGGRLSLHHTGEGNFAHLSGGIYASAEEIAPDDFIRKYGEPHEIEAWFGEEEEKTVEEWIETVGDADIKKALTEAIVKPGYKGKTFQAVIMGGISCTMMMEPSGNDFALKIATRMDKGEDVVTAFYAVTGKNKEQPQNYYPNWEQLTALPDKGRPWAKKGERYVRVTRGDEYVYGCTYTYMGRQNTSPENGKFVGMDRGSYWCKMAKIPGETYATEDGGTEVFGAEKAVEEMMYGAPTLESLSLPLSVGQRFVCTENSPEIKGRFKLVEPNDEDGDDYLNVVYLALEPDGPYCSYGEREECGIFRHPNYGGVFEVLTDKVQGKSYDTIVVDEAAPEAFNILNGAINNDIEKHWCKPEDKPITRRKQGRAKITQDI